MTVTVLFAARADRWAQYEAPLRAALDETGLDYTLSTSAAPEQVDYIIYAPNSDIQDFAPFSKLKAVMNLWAGVEDVVNNPTLTVPLTRMVDDDGLTQGMVEWVTGHVLRHHLGMDAHIVNPDHTWVAKAPPLSRERPVTILGLGTLGTACATALTRLGFPVTGFARSEKTVPGVRCVSDVRTALTDAQIAVLLLPDTPQTRGILNADTLACMAPGAVVLNPGRGPLIDDTALLDALDTGQISHATLDAFETEPLPPESPYWPHPNVTVTPHIASETRPASAARVIARNIAGHEAGAPLQHLVDRDAGY